MQTCLKERCFAVEPGVNTQALFPEKADGYHFHDNDLFYSLCFLARATTLQVSSLRAQNPTTSTLASLWSLAWDGAQSNNSVPREAATEESSLPAPEEHWYLSPRKAKKVHFAAKGTTGTWGLWGEGAQ